VPVAVIKPKSWPKERCLGFYGSDMFTILSKVDGYPNV
jgi:hypothetical protein